MSNDLWFVHWNIWNWTKCREKNCLWTEAEEVLLACKLIAMMSKFLGISCERRKATRVVRRMPHDTQRDCSRRVRIAGSRKWWVERRETCWRWRDWPVGACWRLEPWLRRKSPGWGATPSVNVLRLYWCVNRTGWWQLGWVSGCGLQVRHRRLLLLDWDRRGGWCQGRRNFLNGSRRCSFRCTRLRRGSSGRPRWRGGYLTRIWPFVTGTRCFLSFSPLSSPILKPNLRNTINRKQ